MNILLLHSGNENGNSAEQDTIMQAQEITASLHTLGHRVIARNVTDSLHVVENALAESNYDVVFNLVETFQQSDHLAYQIPELLDKRAIPFTGCSAQGLKLTTNKLLTKQQLQAYSLPTPTFITEDMLLSNNKLEFQDAYIIKSVTENASLGIDKESVVSDQQNMAQALLHKIQQKKAHFGGEWFAERYIAGREFIVPLLACKPGSSPNKNTVSPYILPPSEICFVEFPKNQPAILDFAAKWDEQSFSYHHTPRQFDFSPADQPLIVKLISLAQHCWQALQLTGCARVDFRIDQTGMPWIIDVNANPCLSKDAGLMAAVQQAGFSHNELIQTLLDEARWRQS